MYRTISVALAAAALSACSQPAGPANAGDASEAAEPSGAPTLGRRRGDVYVAFAPQRDSASMLATSGGRLEVVDNCLIFRSELATYLPVFTPSAETFVTDNAVVIAGRAVPLGSEIQTAGGEMGAGADALLERPRPPRCRHRLLRVSSWGVVKR
jgi:hypothetical protein